MTHKISKKFGKIKKIPTGPGVYLMKGARGKILYIGKAANLKRRVESYFARPAPYRREASGSGPHEARIQKLLNEVKKIDFQKTDSALEALILEAELIKKYQPPFNVREKDDKSFLYVEITKEKFPRVLLVRGKDKKPGLKYYGPYTSSKSIREALRIIRKIFPFSIHPPEKIGKFKRPCFEYEIGLCPGTCIDINTNVIMDVITKKEYKKNIRNVKLFFEGKKRQIIKNLKKEMNQAAKKQEFERAEKLKRQIFKLQHIYDIALINQPELKVKKNKLRIEGYDVSNISGTSAVGVMVVFSGGKPNKKEYRKFKIRTIKKADDVGMLKEVLRRRLKHDEWKLSDLILIDGGKGQINGAKEVLKEFGFKIPVVGIAKGKDRKKNEFIGFTSKHIDDKLLIGVRDEAHRFAINYHKKLRKYVTRQ